jgi:hypothetical protein
MVLVTCTGRGGKLMSLEAEYTVGVLEFIRSAVVLCVCCISSAERTILKVFLIMDRLDVTRNSLAAWSKLMLIRPRHWLNGN